MSEVIEDDEYALIAKDGEPELSVCYPEPLNPNPYRSGARMSNYLMACGELSFWPGFVDFIIELHLRPDRIDKSDMMSIRRIVGSFATQNETV